MGLFSIMFSTATFAVGCVFGTLVMIRTFWFVVRNPKRAFYVKERMDPPKCLLDPSLGTHHFIHLENVRLHYVANGEEGKPLMLFVHGFPEFWYSWRYQLTEFSRDYRVVAIDQRGYNESDKPAGIMNYKVSDMVTDLKQIIPALGYKSCILVGHDWGGAVCWAFASKYPDLIDKLVVMNCPDMGSFLPYALANPSQLLKSWYIYLFQLPWIPEFNFWLNDYKNIEIIFSGKGSGVMCGTISKDDIEAYKYAFSRPGASTAAINYYRAATRTFSRQDATQINIPTKIIWGCKDAALEKGLAEICKKFVTNLSIDYLEESSHWVQIDEPDKVNQIIKAFLKDEQNK
ncbi:hypothetical protein LOTGIDRAFT_228018 [Lottia gigantea]|uniref:AB hydrolase-1 domain-containing protein n=1 Tax=Lottia gigantea TaxID=225164 RepID=V4BHS9_LOTGI|nr:hypothetical protein LOTGIDRAFT_228018 [Lottia gigantea]ESP05422.1 hypothetical protein LOTGIDRAFT_228018 [Lottia gigantea]